MEQGEVIAHGTPDDMREQLGVKNDLTLDNLLRAAILRRRGHDVDLDDEEEYDEDEAEAQDDASEEVAAPVPEKKSFAPKSKKKR
jgi:CO dehydrogenase/acetyl-CoA synthase beta subunit